MKLLNGTHNTNIMQTNSKYYTVVGVFESRQYYELTLKLACFPSRKLLIKIFNEKLTHSGLAWTFLTIRELSHAEYLNYTKP